MLLPWRAASPMAAGGLAKFIQAPWGAAWKRAPPSPKPAASGPRSVDDLNDIDYGAWQFKTFDDARKDNAALFAAWFATPHLVRFPNGESLQDLAARGANVVRFVLARHPDDTIVLVGHDSVNRALLLQCLDLPPSAYWRVAQDPCCLNEIDIDGEKVCILRVNETHHLDSTVADG